MGCMAAVEYGMLVVVSKSVLLVGFLDSGVLVFRLLGRYL